jgi:membrane-associated protease RseP (regulator of RpoE activity)
MDVYKLLSLSVMLNINLAFLNLLPILPLDGGKIAMDILQRLRLPVQRLHLPMAMAGWIMLLGLMIGVTVNDISKFWA